LTPGGEVGVAEVAFAAYEEDGDGVTADRADFFVPLDRHVLERVGGVDGKGDEDDVRFGVGKRS
jgi:hypothetical protein